MPRSLHCSGGEFRLVEAHLESGPRHRQVRKEGFESLEPNRVPPFGARVKAPARPRERRPTPSSSLRCSSPASSVAPVSRSRSRRERRPFVDHVLQCRPVLALQSFEQRQTIFNLLQPLRETHRRRRSIERRKKARSSSCPLMPSRASTYGANCGSMVASSPDAFPHSAKPGEDRGVALVERGVAILHTAAESVPRWRAPAWSRRAPRLHQPSARPSRSRQAETQSDRAAPLFSRASMRERSSCSRKTRTAFHDAPTVAAPRLEPRVCIK